MEELKEFWTVNNSDGAGEWGNSGSIGACNNSGSWRMDNADNVLENE